MSLALSNVQALTVKNVYRSIQTFLNHKAKKSSNTKKAYETDIKLFFSYMRGKELNQLTEQDLQFTNEEVIEYQDWLLSLKNNDGKNRYKNSSINRKINSLRALYDFFEKNGYNVNKYAFDIEELPETDSECKGILSKDEAELMAIEALELPNGFEKSILIELAYKTSIRLNALLSLTWDNFKQINDTTWIVEVIDKGNKIDKKPISNDFYQRILNLKKNGTNKVFNMGRTTANETIRELCKRLGIDEKRNISFHSLKNVGVNYILEQTGDIVAASKQANHSSIQTTYNHYINKTIDFSKYAGIMMEKEIDLTPFEKLSADQWFNLIKKSSIRTQNELLQLLQQEMK